MQIDTKLDLVNLAASVVSAAQLIRHSFAPAKVGKYSLSSNQTSSRIRINAWRSVALPAEDRS